MPTAHKTQAPSFVPSADLATHLVVSREAWLTARKGLLEQERALTHEQARLAAARRALPWVEITKPYVFEGAAGPVALSDLFQGRSQLIVYHFMFGADWQAGCPGCSLWADSFDRAVPHLAGADVSLVAVSTAPLAKLLAYRARLGWTFDWVSAGKSDFGRDFGVNFDPDDVSAGKRVYNYGKETPHGREKQGISVFFRSGDRLFHTYSCYARGVELMSVAHQYLDLVPKGRQEPEAPMAWVKRRDEYGL